MWAGDGPRRAYADEVAAVYRAYRDGLEAAGLVDQELFAWRALDALRLNPAAWGGTPLFVYGFDDFDALQLDALETIGPRDADVRVSLPFEPGRRAFKATATLHQELLARGAEEHRARAGRRALRRRIRGPRSISSSGCCSRTPGEPVDPGAAISFHCAGGERAEVELAAARILDLLRQGVVPGDVAVVFRRPRSYSSLLEQVFGAYGIPYSIDRKRAVRPHRASGAGCWR